jgi:ATP-binding cassette subfamily D (ALD) long-chain fatty acid import protein
MQTFSKPLSESVSSLLTRRRAQIASAAALSFAAAVLINGRNQQKKKNEQAHLHSKNQALERVLLPFSQQSLQKPPKSLLAHTLPETIRQHKHYFKPVDTSQKVGVNNEFFRQLKAIFKILLPNFRTKEALLIVLHSIFLVLRTWLSVVVARLDGRIVKNLVAANGRAFAMSLVEWFAIAIPATYTNSMVRERRHRTTPRCIFALQL